MCQEIVKVTEEEVSAELLKTYILLAYALTAAVPLVFRIGGKSIQAWWKC